MLRNWLVAADDRTGALEVAADLAGFDRPVPVTVSALPDGDGVVDLGTRALVEVADVVSAVDLVRDLPGQGWQAHKIDSTLRGHWPVELAGRGRVLMVPAWPAMGRTCRDGVVHVHGRPVASIRERLREVVLLPGLDALEGWLQAGDGIAACDVADTAQLAAVAALVAEARSFTGHGLLLSGPAGAIGALHRARFGAGRAAPPPTAIRRAVAPLVLCASATPTSTTQLDRLRALRPDVEVHRTPAATGPLDPDVAARFADAVRDRIAQADLVVVIGGDTAAAVLGDAPRLVGGWAAPGMPWSLDAAGGGPLVVTKAGGFGDPDALVQLLNGETG